MTLILLRLAFKNLKASERKPQMEKRRPMQSALTEAVYVLYQLLEMKMLQKAHHSADDRCQPQAWIKSSPPQGVEHLGFELGPTQLAA